MIHTPGPWGLAQYAKGAHLPIPFHEHKTVAVFSDGARQGDVAYMQHGLWGDEQALANARLIAAAPDLLEALQVAADALCDLPLMDPRVVAIRAAIAKATGGSHE